MQPKESWHLLHRNPSDAATSFPNGLIISTSSDANMLTNEQNNNSTLSPSQPDPPRQKPAKSILSTVASSFDNPTFDTRF
jgi:hypothetical protein